MSGGPQRDQGPPVRSRVAEEQMPSTSGAHQSPSLQTLKEEVVTLLQSYPEGIEVSRLTLLYRRLYGRRFGPLSSYGLSGLQELFLQIGDRVCVERTHGNNMIRAVNPGLRGQDNGSVHGVAKSAWTCQNCNLLFPEEHFSQMDNPL